MVIFLPSLTGADAVRLREACVCASDGRGVTSRRTTAKQGKTWIALRAYVCVGRGAPAALKY